MSTAEHQHNPVGEVSGEMLCVTCRERGAHVLPGFISYMTRVLASQIPTEAVVSRWLIWAGTAEEFWPAWHVWRHVMREMDLEFAAFGVNRAIPATQPISREPLEKNT